MIIQALHIHSITGKNLSGVAVQFATQDQKNATLLLCLALSTKELETVWPAWSQNNGLGWDITAYLWGGVSVG